MDRGDTVINIRGYAAFTGDVWAHKIVIPFYVVY